MRLWIFILLFIFSIPVLEAKEKVLPSLESVVAQLNDCRLMDRVGLKRPVKKIDNLEARKLRIQFLEKEVKSSNPGDAHYELGFILGYDQGEIRHALAHWDRFLTQNILKDHQDPRLEEVASQMCFLGSFLKGSQSQAPRLIKKMEAALNQKGIERKKKSLQDIVDFEPNPTIPLYYLGLIEEEFGNWKNARKCFEKAINQDPTCALCHEELSIVLEKVKDNKLSIVHKTKAGLYQK